MKGKIKIGNAYYGLTERGILVLILLIGFIAILFFLLTQPRQVEVIYKEVNNLFTHQETIKEPVQPRV